MRGGLVLGAGSDGLGMDAWPMLRWGLRGLACSPGNRFASWAGDRLGVWMGVRVGVCVGVCVLSVGVWRGVCSHTADVEKSPKRSASSSSIDRVGRSA